MIHNTPQGGKFRRLVRRLRPLLADCPVAIETIAVGLLERLWHATQVSAIRGDIGKFDNEEIAEMVGWHGDADALVNILADERWLDRCAVNRFLVHDWQDHAPRHVKGNVAKLGGFLTVVPATISCCEPPMESPCVATATPSDMTASPSDVKEATPNRTEPNLTKPNPTDRPTECAGVRADGRELEMPPDGDRLVLGPGRWRESQPTRERIARVVSGDPEVTPKKIRAPDLELCVRAAAVSHWGDMPGGWLDGVLKSIQARKTPPENRWAFFRASLIKAAERAGKNYHEAEARVFIPPSRVVAENPHA